MLLGFAETPRAPGQPRVATAIHVELWCWRDQLRRERVLAGQEGHERVRDVLARGVECSLRVDVNPLADLQVRFEQRDLEAAKHSAIGPPR